MNPAAGSLDAELRRAATHRAANAGTSMTAPYAKPLQEAPRAAETPREVALLSGRRGGIGHGAVSKEGNRTDHRSIGSHSRRRVLYAIRTLAFASNRAYAAAHFALELDDRRQRRPVPLDRRRQHQSRRHDLSEAAATTTVAPARQAEVRGHQAPGRHGDVRAVLRLDLEVLHGHADRKSRRDHRGRFLLQGARAPRTFTGGDHQRADVPQARRVRQERRVHECRHRRRGHQVQGGSGERSALGRLSSRSCGPSCNFRFTLDGLRAAADASARSTRSRSSRTSSSTTWAGRERRSSRRARSTSRTSSFYIPEADAQAFYEHATRRRT